jgi:hypothetical protein
VCLHKGYIKIPSVLSLLLIVFGYHPNSR